jgi:hypothetical protein
MSGRSERMSEKYENFICLCCGSKNYFEHYGQIGDPMLNPMGPGNAGNKRFLYCSCAGCSVMFIDAKAFSRK